ncbi:TIGR03617 family F420-dependent LLM class oxidoreductase [Mycobacterium paragordonae]|uniref:TIGR03617 family F420-dependent LLM class oxidoreductase n=1 Tax=Mycobacterium paragordonae TaxID=1389713 RepID=UPI00105B7487|nr:TIGR03617 family F420-dependent LLM class oxidoreductase [Mycobacterium paragordonae]TDK94301.1 TIGR03617 family F420-dependent LLM class oxidoreductase [Mycobacterium paragordonae]
MQVLAALAPELPLSQVGGYVRRVEELGFDGVHIAETIHDSLMVAALAVEHTTRLTIRTAVTLAFVRSPTLTAYSAWDLAHLSGGRFELGLGSQIKQNIEDRFGMPWSEPQARMREYVEAVQALFAAFGSGGPVHYTGQSYRLTRLQPYFNPGPSDLPAPPIWLGAVNAGMCELAGRSARGVVTHSTNSDPDYLRDVVRPALERGAAAAGRRQAPLLTVSTAIATGHSDDEVDGEWERQRRMLAFLLSTPAYAGALRRRGRTSLPDRLRTLTRGQRWDELPGVLDDTVLAELVVRGRYEQLPRLLWDRYGDIADGVVLPPATGQGDESLARCVRELRQGPRSVD